MKVPAEEEIIRIDTRLGGPGKIVLDGREYEIFAYPAQKALTSKITSMLPTGY